MIIAHRAQGRPPGTSVASGYITGQMSTHGRSTVEVSAEERRVLEAIARQHGHGPRRPLALLDIAWAATGSLEDGRAALQRLLAHDLIELQQGCQTTADCIGWLSDLGAQLLGYS